MMVSAISESLLQSSSTETAHIEMTSQCNLRCVYCAVSQPSYRGFDLNLDCIEEVLDTLKDRRVKYLYVNGHGETTMIANWESTCLKMLDRGFRLKIVSNFSRKLRESEIDVFCKFHEICVSCDTTDPELFTLLRRKAKLSNLFENIERIKSRCREMKIPGPRFAWSVVVCDRTVFGLVEVVQKGIDLGISHFEFCNLTRYPDLPGAIQVRHISELPVEDMIRSREIIKLARNTATRNGCTFSVQAGLIDVLEERIKSSEGKQGSLESGFLRYSKEEAEGKTRLCLDPWKMLYIHASGAVRPCCWHWDEIGNLGSGQTLSEISNNSKMLELRRQLLTGELGKYCSSCPARELVTVDELESSVLAFQTGERDRSAELENRILQQSGLLRWLRRGLFGKVLGGGRQRRRADGATE